MGRHEATLLILGSMVLTIFKCYEAAGIVALQAIALAIMSKSKPEDGEA